MSSREKYGTLQLMHSFEVNHQDLSGLTNSDVILKRTHQSMLTSKECINWLVLEVKLDMTFVKIANS